MIDSGTDENYVFRVEGQHEFVMPVFKWQWCLNGDWETLVVSVIHEPSWFQRKMQRLVLGIHWRKIDD